MTRTATRGGLRLLICGLCAILVLLCLGVVFYEMFYMPEPGTAEEKVCFTQRPTAIPCGIIPRA